MFCGIQNGNFDNDEKKKKLIASIPFYRNISEYMLMKPKVDKLTCLLHIKSSPINTESINLSEIWDIIVPIAKSSNNFGNTNNDENYLLALKRIALDICNLSTEETILENKIILSMAIRLEVEKFLKKILIKHNIDLKVNSKQTRKWSEKAEAYLDVHQKNIIDEVNLMTTESIHVNSFMYEPLIDISNWNLKRLYKDVLSLNDMN